MVGLPPHLGGIRNSSQSNTRRKFMKSTKQTQAFRKPAQKIIDPRRVRFGAGNAPRVVRQLDVATHDAKAIRFGAGNCPASLRK
jgi:hypothetical protein